MRASLVDCEGSENTQLRSESCVRIECCALNFALTSTYVIYMYIYCILYVIDYMYLYNSKIAPVHIL